MRSHNDEFLSRYPAIKIVLGTFDDFAIIEKATSEAELIIHAGDIDHAGCVAAVLSGLSLRTKQQKKTFLLHLTGTGCISDELTNDWTGSYNPRMWNDITDIEAIYNLPDEALHHLLDKQIMDASNEYVKTACIAPSDVYGQSKAVGNRTTHMVPFYVSTALKCGETFYLGQGQNVKAVVHVDDIAQFFARSVCKATTTSSSRLSQKLKAAGVQPSFLALAAVACVLEPHRYLGNRGHLGTTFDTFSQDQETGAVPSGRHFWEIKMPVIASATNLHCTDSSLTTK